MLSALALLSELGLRLVLRLYPPTICQRSSLVLVLMLVLALATQAMELWLRFPMTCQRSSLVLVLMLVLALATQAMQAMVNDQAEATQTYLRFLRHSQGTGDQQAMPSTQA